MNKHYFKITVKFRAQSWVFRIVCTFISEITDELVYKIVCEYYKTTLERSEIGYTKTGMSYYDFIISTLPKFSTESIEKDSALTEKTFGKYFDAIPS